MYNICVTYKETTSVDRAGDCDLQPVEMASVHPLLYEGDAYKSADKCSFPDPPSPTVLSTRACWADCLSETVRGRSLGLSGEIQLVPSFATGRFALLNRLS